MCPLKAGHTVDFKALELINLINQNKLYGKKQMKNRDI